MLAHISTLRFCSEIAVKMPGKVRVKLLAARNLPIMDRASEACDAFGEVRTFLRFSFGSVYVC